MKFHLRRGNEAAQTVDRRDETALDDLRNLRLNRLAVLFQRLDLFPCNHTVGTNLGNRSAILAAETHDEDLDLVVDLHDILSGIRLRRGKLPLRDGDVRLETGNVDISLTIVDSDDRSLDDIVFPYLLHGLLFSLKQTLHVLFLHF